MTRATKSALWGIGLVVVAGFLTIIAGCSAGRSLDTGRSPGAVVRDFYTLLGKGEYDAAARHMTGEARAAFSLWEHGDFGPPLELFVADAQFSGRELRAIRITQEEIGDDTARVYYILEYTDGTRDDERSGELVRESGQWRIKG